MFNKLKNYWSNRPSISQITYLNAIVALWLVVIANTSFFKAFMKFSPVSGGKAYALFIATFILLFALMNLILQLISVGRLAKPMLTFWLCMAGSVAYCVDAFGVGIDVGQIQNLLQTDAHEVRDLVGINAILYSVVIFIIPAILLWRVKVLPSTLKKSFLVRMTAILLSLVATGIIAKIYYVDYASTFREHRELSDKITPTNAIFSLVRFGVKNIHFAPKPLIKYGTDAKKLPARQGEKPKLFVLVVGETARAESFSLNGYARETNPELKKQDVINFSQVSSCGTATAVSLPCMFSGFTRDDYNASTASHREGLLDILQYAGYEVTWIDNQSGCKKVCDRVKQQPVIESRKSALCADGECRDNLLLESFQLYLKDAPVKDRVIVLHGQGSHGPTYFKRYPAEYEQFKPACRTSNLQNCTQQEIINTYDNTILYTDFILSSVIDVLKGREKDYETVFLYVSDHGESTGEHGLYLHGAPYAIAPSQQTHIPMFVWASADYKTNHAQKTACLVKNKPAVLSHDNLFHSVIGMMDVTTSVYNPELDMTHCP